LLDLATKHWIFEELGRPGEKEIWWIIPNVFGFQTSINQGALFGIGQGQIPLFVTLSFIALIGVFWWVWADITKNRYLALTLGLIAAGILGNLWDRCALHGMKWTEFDLAVWNATDPELLGQPIHGVRDWILVMIGNYPWPNFNIADSCLVCGAILVGIYAFFAPDPKELAAAAAASLKEKENEEKE
jgi:signal peptidase II